MGIISNLLFGDNQEKTSYRDAAIKKRYSDISNATYDSMYGGLNDYLDNNYEGGASKYKYDFLEGLKNDADSAKSNYNATKNNVFGNGIIGGLLNPIAQTVSGITDLGGLALSGGKVNAWDSSKDALGVSRDIGSDLGALGETALTIAPIARGAYLAKGAATQIPRTLGQKIAEGALFGAGYGATGSLRDMGFENFDPGQFATSTALSAGIGGGLAGLGGLIGKYTSSKVPTTASATPYQEALNNLKNNATSTARYSDVATNLPTTQGLDISRINLNNLDEDTLKQLFRSGVKNAKSQVAGADTNALTTTLTENKNLLQDFLKKGIPSSTTYETVKPKNISEALNNLKTNLGNTKAGTKVSKLLKTKKGKVLAGGGAGLLLAQLMKNNNNSNSGQLSDEEMQELYNYVYRGGQ